MKTISGPQKQSFEKPMKCKLTITTRFEINVVKRAGNVNYNLNNRINTMELGLVGKFLYFTMSLLRNITKTYKRINTEMN